MIYEAFNITFWIIAAFFGFITTILIKALRKKSEEQRKKFLIVYCLIWLVIFFVYKNCLLHDTAYLEMVGLQGRTIWGELPLYPCNVIMLLLPIALLTENKGVMIFCFYTSMICAPIALLIPSFGFRGFSIFIPRVMGFVFSHWMIFAVWALLYFLDIYTPHYRDIPKYLVTAVCTAFGMFLVNLTFKATGLCADSNYFFSMYPESVELQFMYDLIPIKFVYTLPAFVVLAMIAYMITPLFVYIEKKR